MSEQPAVSSSLSHSRVRTPRWCIWWFVACAPVWWMALWLINHHLLGAPVRPWVRLTADVGLLVWVIWRLRQQKQHLAEIGLTTDWFGREALIGLLVGCGLWLIALMPVWFLRWFNINVPTAALPSIAAPAQWVHVIIIAVCEEIVWRGYVLTELHRLYRLSSSVVIAVLAYTAFRLGEAVALDWFVVPSSLYVGGWLCVVYLWRRSLIAPILAHIALSGLGLAGLRAW